MYLFLKFLKTGETLAHDGDMSIILTSAQNNQHISLKTRLNLIYIVFKTCEEELEIAEHGTGFRFLVYPAGEYFRCINTHVFSPFLPKGTTFTSSCSLLCMTKPFQNVVYS